MSFVPAFSLSPTDYTVTLPNEVVAIDLAVTGEGFTNMHQAFGMNVDGVDHYMGDFVNLTGADPWHIPLVYPDPMHGIAVTPGVHKIFVKSYLNNVPDGMIQSNTITITVPSTPPPSQLPFPWWLVLVAVGLGAVTVYAVRKRKKKG